MTAFLCAVAIYVVWSFVATDTAVTTSDWAYLGVLAMLAVAGIGETFVRSTLFTEESLVRRTGFGRTIVHDYAEISEIVIADSRFMDISFDDGTKWRLWALESDPLSLWRFLEVKIRQDPARGVAVEFMPSRRQ